MGQLFTFQGVGQAQIVDRPPKLKDGFVGVVEITRTEVGPTRQAGPKFFVNFRIVESNMPNVHPVGQLCSWGQKLLDQSVANGALKKFVAAVAGVPLDNKAQLDQLEPHMDNIINSAIANPDVAGVNQLIGRKVRVDAKQGKTGEGRDFVFHRWSPL